MIVHKCCGELLFLIHFITNDDTKFDNATGSFSSCIFLIASFSRIHHRTALGMTPCRDCCSSGRSSKKPRDFCSRTQSIVYSRMVIVFSEQFWDAPKQQTSCCVCVCFAFFDGSELREKIKWTTKKITTITHKDWRRAGASTRTGTGTLVLVLTWILNSTHHRHHSVQHSFNRIDTLDSETTRYVYNSLSLSLSISTPNE